MHNQELKLKLHSEAAPPERTATNLMYDRLPAAKTCTSSKLWSQRITSMDEIGEYDMNRDNRIAA